MIRTVRVPSGLELSSNPSPIPLRTLHGHLKSLVYHIHTLYLFSCNNIKDIICMGFLFGSLNALIAPRFHMGPALSPAQILMSSPSMLLWSWSNLFLFNLHNQRHPAAIAEDALNKPWRPLPSGRLTAQQATLIMYCMYPVIMVVALRSGGLVPCFLEAVFCLWYNEWGGASHPFLKNLQNGLGFACFFAGPLEVATQHSIFSGRSEAAIWLFILAVAVTTTSHTQDFRDMRGDRATGRKTVPLVIGDMNSRRVVAAGVGVWTGVACWFWDAGWEGTMAWLTGAMMVWNLFKYRSTAGDIFTWNLWPFWILGLFLVPVLKELRAASTK